MLKQQRGHFLAVASLVLLIVMVGLAFIFLRSQTSDEAKDTQDNRGVQDGTKDDTTVYKDTGFNFEITIPSKWQAKNTSIYFEGVPQILGLELSDESGTYIASLSQVTGKGGDCEPIETDVPFKVGNQCPTQEYLNFLPTSHGGGLYRSRLHDGVSNYGYCYSDSGSSPDRDIDKPIMGFVLLCGGDDIYIDINGKESTIYDEPHIKELEKALLTITL